MVDGRLRQGGGCPLRSLHARAALAFAGVSSAVRRLRGLAAPVVAGRSVGAAGRVLARAVGGSTGSAGVADRPATPRRPVTSRRAARFHPAGGTNTATA